MEHIWTCAGIFKSGLAFQELFLCFFPSRTVRTPNLPQSLAGLLKRALIDLTNARIRDDSPFSFVIQMGVSENRWTCGIPPFAWFPPRFFIISHSIAILRGNPEVICRLWHCPCCTFCSFLLVWSDSPWPSTSNYRHGLWKRILCRGLQVLGIASHGHRWQLVHSMVGSLGFQMVSCRLPVSPYAVLVACGRIVAASSKCRQSIVDSMLRLQDVCCWRLGCGTLYLSLICFHKYAFNLFQIHGEILQATQSSHALFEWIPSSGISLNLWTWRRLSKEKPAISIWLTITAKQRRRELRECGFGLKMGCIPQASHGLASFSPSQ